MLEANIWPHLTTKKSPFGGGLWKNNVETSHKAPDYQLIINKKIIDAHILKGYKAKRSHTKGYKLRNAHIPKRLRGKDTHKYTKKIQVKCSHTDYYKAKELAHIPETATRQRYSYTTIATRWPTSILSKRYREYSAKTQNVRSMRRAGESKLYHPPRLQKLYTMAILHPETAQTEELRLGSHKKSKANKKDRESRHHSYKPCINQHNDSSTLDCFFNQTQGASNLYE